MHSRALKNRVRAKGAPEDSLFASMGRVKPRGGGTEKGAKVAILKSAGLIRQAGRHLEPTAKGRRAIRKRRA